LLTELNIQNYALIDHLKIDFSSGFSVITGETGSGKSILLGALSLILGERADLKSIRDTTKKCIIEGHFTINELNIQSWFDKNDVDFESITILRREITPQGKSRAFVNDTPVSLTKLKELSESLIDIHSQHETRLLNEQDFVFEIIDSQLPDYNLIIDYANNYKSYKTSLIELSDLKEQESKSQNEKDYLTFLFDELQEINLEKILSTDIEQEYNLLSNAEEITQILSEADHLFNNESSGCLSALKKIGNQLERLSTISPEFEALSTRASSSLIELDDIANDLASQNNVEFDAQKLSILEEQMSTMNRLVQKHNVENYEALLIKKNEIDLKIADIGSISTQIEKLENKLNKLEKNLLKDALKISKERKKIIPNLESNGHQLLSKMSMPNAYFKFDLNKLETLGVFGIDQVNLLAKTNLGGDFKPLKKFASGGESSRIMLAIKSLQSQNKSLPSIIFDEIDTGVSGEVAENMGDIMRDLGQKMQVISITHLPQIASKGQHHYKVYKEEKNNTTTSSIIQLDAENRVQEIANMLSGSTISDAAIKNAKELLKI